jgi:hypothetical protein
LRDLDVDRSVALGQVVGKWVASFQTRLLTEGKVEWRGALVKMAFGFHREWGNFNSCMTISF